MKRRAQGARPLVWSEYLSRFAGDDTVSGRAVHLDLRISFAMIALRILSAVPEAQSQNPNRFRV